MLSVQSVIETAAAYRIYGVMLRVNRSLPLLSGIELSTEREQENFALKALADIRVNIRESERALQMGPSVADGSVKYVKGSAWRMEGRSQGTAYVLQLRQAAEALWVEVSPAGSQIEIRYWGMPLAEVTALLVGCVLGVAMRLQGLMCLHSSVVAVGGKAIAFIGEKGAGKSTTAAAMAQLGFRVLTDDIAVIIRVGERFYVHPGYPCLRLWDTAATALRGSTHELARVFRAMNKHFVSLEGAESWQFERSALLLSAVYVLGARCEERMRPSWTVLEKVEGLRILMANQYPQWLRLEDLGLRKEIDMLSRIVQDVPVRRMQRSDDLGAVDEIAQIVMNVERK